MEVQPSPRCVSAELPRNVAPWNRALSRVLSTDLNDVSLALFADKNLGKTVGGAVTVDLGGAPLGVERHSCRIPCRAKHSAASVRLDNSLT